MQLLHVDSYFFKHFAILGFQGCSSVCSCQLALLGSVHLEVLLMLLVQCVLVQLVPHVCPKVLHLQLQHLVFVLSLDVLKVLLLFLSTQVVGLSLGVDLVDFVQD